MPEMRLVEPGKLCHYVTIEALALTDEPDGTTSEEWNGENRHAHIEPLQGRELFEAQQMKGEATHRITMRWYDGLTPKHRIKFGTRTFNIVSVRNIDEANRMTVAVCKEAT